ncbi:DMT family transporter [Aestuariibacter sp. AA17]|uniref:DMT family transporter n=1 Tax=Fluctibacter corallii TaxID=2984329 RepID=A0ABT3AB62_9ALTE|nr:DMT family transporter [Aestuariibacter sp. AA17]MCV2885868.1 DMT family transporter [Aestuariibacter sp. AA17]
MPNWGLFTLCVLVWGSTWLAITYQLTEIHPVLSVAYRFSLAAFALLLFCLFKKRSLRLPFKLHVLCMGVGLSLYTLDYSLLYESQRYLVSAIVALMSSCIIYFNVALRRLVLKKPFEKEVIFGATFGVLGLGCIFYEQFAYVEVSSLLWLGMGLAMVSFVFASIGNVISEKILSHGIPVLQMNFWSMFYSLFFLYGYAIVSGAEFTFPSETSYVLSLLYLSLIGSVLAFGAYMKLVQGIGSDRAAFVVLIYPIVALILSTLFEGYQWTALSLFGVAIVIVGNAIAMGKFPYRRFAVSRAPVR